MTRFRFHRFWQSALVLAHAESDHRVRARPGDGVASLVALPLGGMDHGPGGLTRGVLLVSRTTSDAFEPDDLAALDCTTQVLAGVIPVTNPKSVKRFADMNGTHTPDDLWNRLEAADPDERLRIACDQAAALIVDLVDLGVLGIHLYTLNVAPMETWSFRIVHVAGALVLGFILFAGARFVSAEEGPARHK